MAEITLRIEGMSCHHCVMAVKSALRGLAGVSSADVSLMGKKAVVSYDPGTVTVEKMKEAVEEAGYQVVG
ncbi:MAG: copper ion binding protein [Firmicutes bacterium]|nr:copper ion binding protein [Bacillota bacterium]